MYLTIGLSNVPAISVRVLTRLMLAASCVACGVAGATDLLINGVDGALADNVRLTIGTPPPAEDTRRYNRFVDSIETQALDALSALGYYSATINVSEQPASKETAAIITLDIKPDKPVRLAEPSIQVLGPAANDPLFESVIQTLDLNKGDIFNSARYESAKSKLISTAQDLGYFDFEFVQNEVQVSRRNLTAFIKLVAQSGERYRFGSIVFDKSTLTGTFLKRWLTFDTGDPYESGLIGELTQNLQSSGYFDGVRVKPIIDPRYKQVVPVQIGLTRKQNNEIAIGIGYATDTEFRTKLTWGKPLINKRGHSAEFTVGLSREKQSAGFSYRIPRDAAPLYNFWSIEYGLTNDTSGDTDSFLSTLNLQRVSRTAKEWTESRFLRWERETFTSGGEEDRTDLLLPGISYSRSRSKGSPFATWGQAVTFQLLGGSKRLVSSIDIIKSIGTFKYLRAVTERNTFIGTLQYGAIKSNDYERLPVSQRFFAGGDRSIRGFAYRDVSPRNADDKAVGGRYLEVASVEYNYRFRDRWSAAVFTDAGRAFNEPDTGYSVGAGVGLRWQSPVGPFRVDIATPISDNDYGSVRLHLSLGPDL